MYVFSIVVILLQLLSRCGCTLAAEKIVGLGYGVGDAVAQGFKKELSSKLSLYTGDQSDTQFLQRMKADLSHVQFDVIVDDGSHVPWHQLLTFEIMFDTWLKPGGLYIIEDVETSYWDGTNPRIYGYDIIDAGVGRKGSVVEKFKASAHFQSFLSQASYFSDFSLLAVDC